MVLTSGVLGQGVAVSPGPAVVAVWAGESGLELCRGSLRHSPYVSNFTVVFFISFSIWA